MLSVSVHSSRVQQNGEVTVGARDGAAHVLRCLKVWYDLPSDVLVVAVNLVDRFLAKMRVKPKHMACISVGSFLLAVRQLKMEFNDTDDLVAISQVRSIQNHLFFLCLHFLLTFQGANDRRQPLDTKSEFK